MAKSKEPTPATDAKSGSAEPVSLTAREIQLLGWAMMSLKGGPPEIDAENLARLAGMTHVGSARNAWNAIRKKLNAGAGKLAENTTDTVTTPSRKTAAKRTKPTEDADDNQEPTPKRRGRKPKAVKEAEMKAAELKQAELNKGVDVKENEDAKITHDQEDDDTNDMPIKQEDSVEESVEDTLASMVD